MKTEDITIVNFNDAIEERYYAYAMSTIMSRSLPDVRDGLKPVHRRLLYAMLQLKLDPKSGFKKCARVVGDVIGKYHPHGDVAVYDTMVRLAQEFSVRYPLVEGQGNFGSVDGDNAAAMRYTESRLTEVALALLEDITNDTVDFQPNYDGSEEEPVILPANFPNLLANGSEGIAVGMATSIPPHNAGQLCDALLHLIKHPNSSNEKMVELVEGPDFPTGGIIIEPRANIRKAYETGRGSFRIRAKWEKEELTHGLYQIIITEIPYQVQKSKLIEKIADLFKAKKLALLGNIRDESTEEIRVVLEPKNRTVDPEMLMESLFKLTDLETRFNLNMNMITLDGSPKVLPLREVLQSFLTHRHDVLVRKVNNRLSKIDHRLEVLGGLLVAYLNLDEVIRIIREEDEPKQMMIKKWSLSEVQVEAILNMRLRSLRKLEEFEIKSEHDKLSAEKDGLLELLNNEDKRWKVIAADIKECRKKFGQNTEIGKRRTVFAAAPDNIGVVAIEAFVEKEPITVVYSEKGWIRTLKGHSHSDIKFKDGDKEKFILQAQTTDKLIIFSSDGKFFTLPCDKLPKGKGFGEPIRIALDLDQEHEPVSILIHQPDRKLFLASNVGKGFIVKEDDVIAMTRTGKQILNLVPNSNASICKIVDGDSIAIIGNNRKLLVFSTDEVPVMKRGQGVKLQFYRAGGEISDIIFFNREDGLSWKLGERTRTEKDLTTWIAKRGYSGRMPPSGFPKNNKF